MYLIEGLGPLGDDGTQTLARFRKALAAPAASDKSLRRFRDIDQAVSVQGISTVQTGAGVIVFAEIRNEIAK